MDTTRVTTTVFLYTRGRCGAWGTCLGTSLDSWWFQELPVRYAQLCSSGHEPILCRAAGAECQLRFGILAVGQP